MKNIPKFTKVQTWKKGLVITGNDLEGKQNIVDFLLCIASNVTRIDRMDFDRKNDFWLKLVERDTEVIVFENINIQRDLEKFFNIVTEGITIQRTERSLPFTIKPLIIIVGLTTTGYKKPEGGSYSARFDFFNLTN